jgi:hypothetical protein
MKGSIKRTLKSRQIGLVKTYHLISGAAATPADSGLDKAYISSVQDLGIGSYKINFIEPSRLDIVVDSIVSATAGAIISVAAVDKSSVTISVIARTDVSAPLDANFYISCVHSTLLDTLF